MYIRKSQTELYNEATKLQTEIELLEIYMKMQKWDKMMHVLNRIGEGVIKLNAKT